LPAACAVLDELVGAERGEREDGDGCDDRASDVVGLHRVEVPLDPEPLPARHQLVEDREIPLVGEAGEGRPDPNDRRPHPDALRFERERLCERLDPGYE